jgi:hypothetical protein
MDLPAINTNSVVMRHNIDNSVHMIGYTIRKEPTIIENYGFRIVCPVITLKDTEVFLLNTALPTIIHLRSRFPSDIISVTPNEESCNLSQIINCNFNIGMHQDDESNKQYLGNRIKLSMVEDVSLKRQLEKQSIKKAVTLHCQLCEFYLTNITSRFNCTAPATTYYHLDRNGDYYLEYFLDSKGLKIKFLIGHNHVFIGTQVTNNTDSQEVQLNIKSGFEYLCKNIWSDIRSGAIMFISTEEIYNTIEYVQEE